MKEKESGEIVWFYNYLMNGVSHGFLSWGRTVAYSLKDLG